MTLQSPDRTRRLLRNRRATPQKTPGAFPGPAAAMLQALLAALLFGASAPLAKLLVGEIEPTPLSGFLYLGSGLSLLLIQGLQRRKDAQVQREAPIRRADLPWLAGVALTGGVAAPIARIARTYKTMLIP